MSKKAKFKIPEGEHFAPIATSFMEDKRFSVEAKGIYVYLWTHAGIRGYIAMPVDRMCQDLNISRNRFYNHVAELKAEGYLTVTKIRSTSTGKFYNRYQLHDPLNAYNFDDEAAMLIKANDYRRAEFKKKKAYKELEPYPAFILDNTPDPEIEALFDKYDISHT